MSGLASVGPGGGAPPGGSSAWTTATVAALIAAVIGVGVAAYAGAVPDSPADCRMMQLHLDTVRVGIPSIDSVGGFCVADRFRPAGALGVDRQPFAGGQSMQFPDGCNSLRFVGPSRGWKWVVVRRVGNTGLNFECSFQPTYNQGDYLLSLGRANAPVQRSYPTALAPSN